MNTEFLTQRTHLIQQMASLQSMEHGSLKAEYRPSSAGGQTCQVGPYYKHQVWQNGRNVSQRISAEEAPGSIQTLLDDGGIGEVIGMRAMMMIVGAFPLLAIVACLRLPRD